MELEDNTVLIGVKVTSLFQLIESEEPVVPPTLPYLPETL